MFKDRVIKFIKRVPKGRVVSYGQAALACGRPRSAREVGRILRMMDLSKDSAPWWRVVNNQGLISIKGNWTATKELQKQLLQKEGVRVGEDFKLDMDLYRYSG